MLFGLNESDIFFDKWFKRLDCIELLRNKDNLDFLKEKIRQIRQKYLTEEKVKNKELDDEEEEDETEKDEMKTEIHVDFNIENLRFCFNRNYSAEKISTFMSIINYVFLISLQKKLTSNVSFEKLENILNKHTRQAPPYAIYVFNEKEKQEILDHVSNFYKFFLMYEISLTKFVDYNIITLDKFVDDIPPPPLSKAAMLSNFIVKNR